MNKIEYIGWISAVLLATCGIPEAYEALKTGDSALTWTFLLMWYFGEIFALIYTMNKNKKVKLIPLLFNYGLNLVLISVIISCKLF